jgi:hypothetical protein
MIEKKRLRDLEVGDYLCDMHYGLKDLAIEGPYKITSTLCFECECGSTFITAHLGRQFYCNKMLVVIEGHRRGCAVTAAYSYDNRRLGFVIIEGE